jgi:hypothetical protein
MDFIESTQIRILGFFECYNRSLVIVDHHPPSHNATAKHCPVCLSILLFTYNLEARSKNRLYFLLYSMASTCFAPDITIK